MITRLVLFGATGDLAGRFLLPALAGLRADGALPDDTVVVGAGHQDWDDATFREHVTARLSQYSPDVPEDVRGWLVGRLSYRRLDPQDPATVAEAVRALDRSGPGRRPGPDGTVGDGGRAPVAVYLALPPRTFEPTISALAGADLPPGSRIAVEKPFGEDLAGAVRLNRLLRDVTSSVGGDSLRIDHILGMPRVRELLRLRGPGGALEPVWDGAHLERVDILWEETLGLAGREGFYDGVGAVRDVLQNHLVQVMALLAMEPPSDDSEAALQDAKAAALRSVHVMAPSEVPLRSRRARYTAGALTGADGAPGPAVGAYADQAGVTPERGTETYGELLLEVDTPRWTGTRFVVRTGKALGVSRKGVALHFRDRAPACDPADADREGDRTLWVELDGPQRSRDEPAVHVNAPGELSAYGHVLEDVLTGGTRTSVGAAESELAWGIVEPVLAAWSAGEVPLLEYPAGSAGPARLGGTDASDGTPSAG